jgi:chromosome segregation ATPase
MGLRAAQTVRQLREQLAQALEGRREALAQAQDYLERLEVANRRINILDTAVGELRKSLEDMRRQRDHAMQCEDNERMRARIAETNLARAMGWADSKMDRPPEMMDFEGVDVNRRIPF